MKKIFPVILFLLLATAANIWAQDIQPKTIEYKPIRPFCTGKQFNIDTVLCRLFAGHYYKATTDYNTDTIRLVAWQSSNFPPISLPYEYDDSPALLPATTGVETRFLDTIAFVDDQQTKNILFATSSSDISVDLMLTGRFSCGFLGLALFKENNDSLCLQTFNAAVGCFGSFSAAPTPTLFRFGANSYGCMVQSCNGGAGGPFTCNSYLIGNTEKGLEVIGNLPLTDRTGSRTARWSTNVQQATATATQTFDTLILTTSGYVVSVDEWEMDCLPTALTNKIKHKKPFSFVMLQTYIFDNGMYQATTTTIKTAPIGNKKKYIDAYYRERGEEVDPW